MKLQYRPEIDGLRAIAVLSVILYHAEIELGNEQLFKGGFFGVDVFFVISGYLITSIFLMEYKNTKKFSLINFYERRIRRLLPALIVVILVSMPIAWNLLLPQQLVDFSRSIINSITFTSNFYWNEVLQEYDAESALLQPFLHTWSLAVEEQFYIIYPLLLLTVFSWHKKKAIFILTTLAFLSLLFSQYMTLESPSFSFYMLPSRLWELLIGGLASCVKLNSAKYKSSERYYLLSVLGFALIVYSFIFIDFNAIHPGIITLIPVFGVFIIIIFADEVSYVTKILSSKFLVGTGLISYSLYLWHYPIFAFGRHLIAVPSWFDKFCWILVSIVLSIISYRFVEIPFRDQRNSAKKTLVCIASTIMIILSINIYWIHNDGFSNRLEYLNSLIKKSKQVWVSQDGQKCHSGGRGRNPVFQLEESCFFNYSSENKNLILVGDSHAATLSEDLRKLAKLNDFNFIQLTNAGCQHIMGFHTRVCRQRANNLTKHLEKYPKSIVVYSARVPLFLEQVKFIGDGGEKEAGYRYITEKDINKDYKARANALVETLDNIKKHSNKLVLVYPIPEQGFHLKDKLFKELRFSKNKENIPTITTSYQKFKDRVFRSYQVLNRVVGNTVYRIFPEKIFCSIESGQCMVSAKDKLYYEKDNHVSPLGSRLIVAQIAKELNLNESF